MRRAQLAGAADTVTSEELKKFGRLLYGTRWQTHLARDLDVHRQTVRGWFRNNWKIRSKRVAQISMLAEQRVAQLNAALQG